MHCEFVKSKLVYIDGLLGCLQILDVCLDCKKMKEKSPVLDSFCFQSCEIGRAHV